MMRIRRHFVHAAAVAIIIFCPPNFVLAGELEKQLLDCVDNGAVEACRSLLEKGADANTVSSYGLPALHTAIEAGHAEIVSLLLKAHADVNLRSSMKSTPLAHAISNPEMLNIVLNAGAIIDAPADSADSTPLMNAVSDKPNLEVVKILLQQGASTKARSRDGDTALHFAVRARPAPPARDNSEVIRLLLDHGADINAVDNKGLSVLMAAAISGSSGTVEFLLSRKANPMLVDTDGGLALAYILNNNASSKSDKGALLFYNYTDDQLNQTMLIIAAAAIPENIAQLVTRGASVNAVKSEQSALMVAAKRRNWGAARYLLQQGAQVNRVSGRNRTPLAEAITAGDTRMVNLLLQYGADPNLHAATEYGVPFVIRAIENEQFEIAEMLIASGTKLDGIYERKTIRKALNEIAEPRIKSALAAKDMNALRRRLWIDQPSEKRIEEIKQLIAGKWIASDDSTKVSYDFRNDGTFTRVVDVFTKIESNGRWRLTNGDLNLHIDNDPLGDSSEIHLPVVRLEQATLLLHNSFKDNADRFVRQGKR